MCKSNQFNMDNLRCNLPCCVYPQYLLHLIHKTIVEYVGIKAFQPNDNRGIPSTRIADERHCDWNSVHSINVESFYNAEKCFCNRMYLFIFRRPLRELRKLKTAWLQARCFSKKPEGSVRESLQIHLIQIEQRDIFDTPEQICRTGISKPHFLIQADGGNIAGYHHPDG